MSSSSLAFFFFFFLCFFSTSMSADDVSGTEADGVTNTDRSPSLSSELLGRCFRCRINEHLTLSVLLIPVLTAYFGVIPLQTEKKSRLLQKNKTAHLLIQILREHHIWKNELQYEKSKLYDDLRTCRCTSQFMHTMQLIHMNTAQFICISC